MKFNLQELKNLLNQIQKHEIKYLSINNKNFELVISTLQSGSVTSPNFQKPKIKKQQSSTTLQAIDVIPQSNNIQKTSSITEAYLTIVSPMVGTFYRSPGPGDPPFIQVLDYVTFNQTVCIIEAMKLMNEIEAEVTGEVIEILVEDGDIVDCGQALMRVKPVKI